VDFWILAASSIRAQVDFRSFPLPQRSHRWNDRVRVEHSEAIQRQL
jgi:hypothetical protein